MRLLGYEILVARKKGFCGFYESGILEEETSRSFIVNGKRYNKKDFQFGVFDPEKERLEVKKFIGRWNKKRKLLPRE